MGALLHTRHCTGWAQSILCIAPIFQKRSGVAVLGRVSCAQALDTASGKACHWAGAPLSSAPPRGTGQCSLFTLDLQQAHLEMLSVVTRVVKCWSMSSIAGRNLPEE